MQKVPLVSILSLCIILAAFFFHACRSDIPVAGNKFPAGKVMSVFIDQSGVVWAGTDIGIISYWNDKWTIYENFNPLPVGEVYDIANQALTPGSGIWIATSNGVRLAECKFNVISSVSIYVKGSSGLLDNRVNAIVIDSLDARWFATPLGLSVFKGSVWYSETAWDDLVINPVISLAAKTDGWIFAGTNGKGVGRFKYDGGIDGITGASYYNSEWSGLPSDTILSIYVDQNNYQWFGTPNGVAFHAAWETKKEWKTFSVNDGLINNRVQAIITDKQGLIWFGTAAGVSCFDGSEWKSYGTSSGLIDPCVNDIAIDANGAVWFATNGGVSCFDGSEWRSFSKQLNPD